MRTIRVIIQIVLVILFLLAGYGINKKLKSMKKPPAQKPRLESAPLLDAGAYNVDSYQIVVKGFGTVEAKQRVEVVPQVSGKIVYCHSQLVDGGFINAGEVLVRIDPRDYELAVENSQAAVARAQVQLDQEVAEAEVAKAEWYQLNPDTEPQSPLVFREPQIRQAQAQLAAAKAQLATSKLALERAEVKLGFDNRISIENVDLGQYVTPGKSIATVYGTDAMEIVVPLRDSELQWFDVPLGYTNGSSKPEAPGAMVDVVADFAGKKHTWQGKVIRALGRIDPQSRMVNVVVEVDKPFAKSNGRPPLVPGMFVELQIKGKELKNVIRLPRYAVHNADEVWVANDSRLHVRQVQVARSDKEFAYIQSGLDDGAVVVLSPLDTVVDNMTIRPVRVDQAQDAEVESK